MPLCGILAFSSLVCVGLMQKGDVMMFTQEAEGNSQAEWLPVSRVCLWVL
jgi:hypothetical protein